MVFLGPDGRLSRLRAGLLPAPFHLAGSFLRANYLSWSDKLRVAYGLARLRSTRGDRPGESFADWLLRHGQTVRTINLLLGDGPGLGPERAARADGRRPRAQGLPRRLPPQPRRVPDGDPARPARASSTAPGSKPGSRRTGVEVRLTTGVRTRRGRTRGRDRGGDAPLGRGDRRRLRRPGRPVRPRPRAAARRPRRADPRPCGARGDAASPITGVHLWFDRPVCPLDHVVTVGRLIQWVFNHTAIQGAVGDRRTGGSGPVPATRHQRGLRSAGAGQDGDPRRRARRAGRDLARRPRGAGCCAGGS